MRELHKSRILGSVAKSAMSPLSHFVWALHMEQFIRYAELGASLLQGKGAGTGWGMDAEIRAAASCIKRPNPVLLDVGAHFGKWATSIAQLFPETQKIILFEPQLECLEELYKLDLPRKVIIPCAVSDRECEQTFFVCKGGWGAASFYERTETFFSDIQQQQIIVPVTTLDNVIEKNQIEFIDFVKFDIEGAELSAFHGATRTFSRKAIGALSLEFGSGNINSRTFFRDFWRFLTNYEYEIFRILPSGHTLRVDQYYEDLEYFRGVSNYVARLAT